MWAPRDEFNYENYYDKIIIIKKNYGNDRIVYSRGIFQKIYNKNNINEYTIKIGFPDTAYTETITTNIIEDIMIDTSIETLGKFYSVRELLYENLGDDIVDFVIFDYIKNNVIHI